MRAEYESTGMLAQTQSLGDGSVLSDLVREGALFRDALEELRSEGLQRCVPYICTDAITRAARDPNIVTAVREILGERGSLVMWGPNIRDAVPNAAEYWHVDTESWHWPTVTVVVGLSGCVPENATTYLAGSHRMDRMPDGGCRHDQIPRGAEALPVKTFSGFGNGRFYVFNARGWHCGNPRVSTRRSMLLMHYQRGKDPRIPQMRDYYEGTWFDRPAAYVVIPGDEHEEVRSDFYPPPAPWKAPEETASRARQAPRSLWSRIKRWL